MPFVSAMAAANCSPNSCRQDTRWPPQALNVAEVYAGMLPNEARRTELCLACLIATT